MFGAKRKRRKQGDQVEPDLPITPMLDMSFQLMAFFILTFQTQKPEAQMLTPLPIEQGGGSIADPLLTNPTKQITFQVDIEAGAGEGDNKGTIKAIKITVKDIPKLPTDTGNLADPQHVINPADSTFEARFLEKLIELRKDYESRYGTTIKVQEKVMTTNAKGEKEVARDENGREKVETADKPLIKVQLDLDKELTTGNYVKLQDLALQAKYSADQPALVVTPNLRTPPKTEEKK